MEIGWQQIENRLDRLESTTGGFSSAHRGILALASGRQIFVKRGVDENTKKWARKEIATYQFLRQQNYSFAPALLSWNNEETAFAIEALPPEDGWCWADDWTRERLEKTLEAMDALAAINPTGKDQDLFGVEGLGADNDGWRALNQSPALQQVLLKKLRKEGEVRLANDIHFAAQAKCSAAFEFRKEAMVHHDVRADNCPWRAAVQTVKLVDWSWTQIGDRRLDVVPLLVHVHKSGLDVTTQYAERLDANALQWFAGFWFKAAATPIWPGGPPHLRNFQLQSGITALKLLHRIGQWQ